MTAKYKWVPNIPLSEEMDIMDELNIWAVGANILTNNDS